MCILAVAFADTDSLGMPTIWGDALFDPARLDDRV